VAAVRVNRREPAELQFDDTSGSAVTGLRNSAVQHRATTLSLTQTLELCRSHEIPAVGLWRNRVAEPGLRAAAARARGRIACYQPCDWVVPLPSDMLLGRGHLGDGHLGDGSIDFPRMSQQALAAGYAGYVEAEIMNQDVWDAPPDETAAIVKVRFAELPGSTRACGTHRRVPCTALFERSPRWPDTRHDPRSRAAPAKTAPWAARR